MIIEGIADLLHPNDPQLLFDAVRENRRLLLRTERADAFARLIPWSTLNALVTPEHIAQGFVRAARQSKFIPNEMIISRAQPDEPSQVLQGNLQSLCQQGLSLVVNCIDDMLPDIAAMSAVVERAFRAPVSTNCYASFARDSAFKAHFDDQNVLILQAHGQKRWRCYGQPYRFPIRHRDFPQPVEPGPAELEMVLEPGDVLYVPRGDVHGAQVEGGHSVHLTVTLRPPRADAVAKHLGQVCGHHDIGRQDLPVLASREEQTAWMAELKEVMHRAIDELDLDDVLDILDRARPPLRHLTLGLNQLVAAGTRVQTALRRRLPLPPAGGERAELVVGDLRARLSAAELGVLGLLQERDTWRVAELAERLEPLTIDDVAKAVADLARRSLVLLAND